MEDNAREDNIACLDEVVVLSSSPKYGMGDDGYYYSKYQTTVFYDQNNDGETALSAIVYRAQLVPVAGVNPLAFSAMPEWITPRVVLFTPVDTEALERLYKRGYQQIVIVGDGESCVEDPVKTVEYCTMDQLHTKVEFQSGLLALMVQQHVLAGFYGIGEQQRGKMFARGLTAGLSGVKHEMLRDRVIEMIGSFRGFDTLEKYVSIGETLTAERLRVAAVRLAGGQRFDVDDVAVCAVCAPDHLSYMIEFAPVHAGLEDVSMVVFYHVGKSCESSGHEWIISALSLDVARGAAAKLVPGDLLRKWKVSISSETPGLASGVIVANNPLSLIMV